MNHCYARVNRVTTTAWTLQVSCFGLFWWKAGPKGVSANPRTCFSSRSSSSAFKRRPTVVGLFLPCSRLLYRAPEFFGRSLFWLRRSFSLVLCSAFCHRTCSRFRSLNFSCPCEPSNSCSVFFPLQALFVDCIFSWFIVPSVMVCTSSVSLCT